MNGCGGMCWVAMTDMASVGLWFIFRVGRSPNPSEHHVLLEKVKQATAKEVYYFVRVKDTASRPLHQGSIGITYVQRN